MERDILYDRVVDYLFQSGDVEPGGRVVETQLAARLGVSRIPVREVLGRLRGQGLLVSDGKGRGMRLRRYSLDDLAHVYEYRELLEGGAARAAARSAGPRDLARLAGIHEKAAALAARGAYQTPEWQAADRGFHQALADASHNDRIGRALKLLLAELHGVFYEPMFLRSVPARGRSQNRSAAARRAEFALREHEAILAAVRAGDAALAERRARHHMRHASRRMRAAMTALPAASESAAAGGR